MSKNTKHKFWKEYLQLLDRESKIQDAQAALGYVELEKPYHHGFNAYLILREDIARRQDAEIFQYLLDNYAYETWSRDTIFYKKTKNGYIDNRPSFKEISEADYLKLDPRYKKYFVHITKRDTPSWDGTIRKFYKCYLEPHYLVMKIKKSYITHRKVIDGELEREFKFVNDKIWDLQQIIQPWEDGFVTEAKRYQNKQLRRRDKINLKKNLTNYRFIIYGDEKYQLTTKRESGYWW